MENKNPALAGFFLLLCFLIGNALAYNRVVFLDLQFTLYFLLILAGTTYVFRFRRLKNYEMIL